MNTYRIGLAAVIGLVLLRMTIGWHFLYQGIGKVESGSFSSAAFLSQAKGPLAERYRNMVPDIDGRERLAQSHWEDLWSDLVAGLEKSPGLDEDQTARVGKTLAARKAQLAWFFDQNRADLDDYFHELERLHADQQQTGGRELPYEQKRLWERQQELRRDAGGWLRSLERLDEDLRGDIRALLSESQLASEPLAREATPLDRMDSLVTFSNLAIGGCLLLGLFTRFAAASGALFLLSIVLAQPELPGIYPPAPISAGRSLLVTKEFVEMMALVPLAFLPTGRWGGLDFFIHHLVMRPLFGRKGADNESD